MSAKSAKIFSFAVHLLTASGILCGFQALFAALDGNWGLTFSWLGLALILDGIDGPLARWVDTKTVLPRFSGERLDLIVDYFNYVAIPAVILSQAPLLPDFARLPAAALILMSALYHFADRESKTSDGYFIGFPAIWNIVVFYLMVFAAPPMIATLSIIMFAVLTFLPLCWMHPMRAQKPRVVNIAVALLWFTAAAATIFADLKPGLWAQMILIATAGYMIALSLVRSFNGPWPKDLRK